MPPSVSLYHPQTDTSTAHKGHSPLLDLSMDVVTMQIPPLGKVYPIGGTIATQKNGE